MTRFIFSRKSLLAWALLVASVLGTLVTAQWVRRDIERTDIRRFGFAADQVALRVHERLQSYELLLRSGVGLFAASNSVTRVDWQRFGEEMDAGNIDPGFQVIGYATVIRPQELIAQIAAVRAEGYPDYTVWPAGDRSVYTSVIYLEPFTGLNLRAFGFDMYSEAVRRAAMDQARDSGLATLSGKVRLVQGDGTEPQPGELMYMAVYRHGMPTDTQSQRRTALAGWVFAPFRIGDLVSGILHDWNGTDDRDVDLSIYDGTVSDKPSLLFDSSGTATKGKATIVSTSRIVEFNGHDWTLGFDPKATGATIDYTPVWATLVGGLLLSMLLFLVVISRAGTKARAQRMARDLTHDIRRHQESLVESEYRWKFAVEGNGDGLWDADVRTGTTFYSTRWKEMLGYAEDEIGNSTEEWRTRIHPDDFDRATQAVDACHSGAAPTYMSEHRMRCKDGSYMWILDRGMVVSRDQEGTPLRMIGTHRDVTERKRSETRITRLTNLYKALSACNEAVVRCRTQDELFQQVCQIAVENGGMSMAWVGVLDEPTARIIPIASCGVGTDYLHDIVVSACADDPHGLGPTGTATRENRPVWLDDYLTDERMAPWRDRGAPFGWAASAALPLCKGGRPIGALTFYATATGWFDDETRELLEKMARDISFAIDKLHAEANAASYQATLVEAEQQFRSLVGQSMTGAYILQDGRVVYANPRLKTILGYSADDDLTGRPASDFVSARELPEALDRMQRLADGEIDLTDSTFTAVRKDGTTVDVGTSNSIATYHQRPAVIGLMQDVSNRKVAEDSIQRYADQLEHTFIQTVGLATTLSEMRDPYTAGHEQRVAELAVSIGQELGLPNAQLEGLRVGGYLHDVGKMAVPAEILVKPSALTPNEMSLIREHAQAGYDVLKGVDFPWPVATVALQHHERLDGSGYPNGLKGDEIILEARIVAVADVVESMSTHRPYRAAKGVVAALEEIERGSGTLYDPEAVAACLRLFRDRQEHPQPVEV